MAFLPLRRKRRICGREGTRSGKNRLACIPVCCRSNPAILRQIIKELGEVERKAQERLDDEVVDAGGGLVEQVADPLHAGPDGVRGHAARTEPQRERHDERKGLEDKLQDAHKEPHA